MITKKNTTHTFICTEKGPHCTISQIVIFQSSLSAAHVHLHFKHFHSNKKVSTGSFFLHCLPLNAAVSIILPTLNFQPEIEDDDCQPKA